MVFNKTWICLECHYEEEISISNEYDFYYNIYQIECSSTPDFTITTLKEINIILEMSQISQNGFKRHRNKI